MRNENQKPTRVTITYNSPIYTEFEDKLRAFMAENEYAFYASGSTVGDDVPMRDISFELEYAVSLPVKLVPLGSALGRKPYLTI